MNNLIPIEKLKDSEAKNLVCFPKYSEEELDRRIEELKMLNVKCLVLDGRKKLGKFFVLGKGHESLVVKALNNKGKFHALKIRRTDSGKPDTTHEVKMIKKAEEAKVGVKLAGSTKNFILLEMVEGKPFPEWVEKLKGKNRKKRLKKVLLEILNQCRALDLVGLDHGELSRASKHILVDKNDKPYLIDFGKASVERKVSNVTSICQYLFIRGDVAEKILKILGKISRKKLIKVLQIYKKKLDKESFLKVLSVLSLKC